MFYFILHNFLNHMLNSPRFNLLIWLVQGLLKIIVNFIIDLHKSLFFFMPLQLIHLFLQNKLSCFLNSLQFVCSQLYFNMIQYLKLWLFLDLTLFFISLLFLNNPLTLSLLKLLHLLLLIDLLLFFNRSMIIYLLFFPLNLLRFLHFFLLLLFLLFFLPLCLIFLLD